MLSISFEVRVPRVIGQPVYALPNDISEQANPCFGARSGGWRTVEINELSASLWRERRQLELLVFRLETQLMHVTAGRSKWLKFTSADLESVLENLRFETLARNIQAATVAAEWGVPADAALLILASAAPSDLGRQLLQDHQRELSSLLQQLISARAANLEALGAAEDAPPRHGPAASPRHDLPEELSRLAEAASLARALAVTSDCAQPLLEQFLGVHRNGTQSGGM